MFEAVDLYCERLDAGFWAEPVNALTNLAFVLAAWLVWRRARRLGALSSETKLLAGMIALIGIGSFLFHTFATGWAEWADVLPILLFELAYLYLYLRRIAGMRPAAAAGMTALYLPVGLASGGFPNLLNGSLSYAPALVVLFALGLYHYASQKKARRMLLAAAALFFVSLTFRTTDMAVCPSFPLGTHFIWHLLNALTLYLLMLGYLANLPVNKSAI